MILKQKLTNAIRKAGDGRCYEFKLCNIEVNGRKTGCSGFITNPKNAACVYVDTEGSCYGPLSGKIMYRYAYDTYDYSGFTNRWASNLEDLAEAVNRLLEVSVIFTGEWPANQKEEH